MTVHDIDVKTLSGQDASLGDLAGTTVLVVNVASECGLTPQYDATLTTSTVVPARSPRDASWPLRVLTSMSWRVT